MVLIECEDLIIGMSMTKPHTCGGKRENGKLFICIYRNVYMYGGWYVRIPQMHSALFVHNVIFLCMLAIR